MGWRGAAKMGVALTAARSIAVFCAIVFPAIGWAGEKPQQYPTGFDCQTLPATDRATCRRTQIEPPELEPPAPAPRTSVPQPIYPGGKLPPPAMPDPRGDGS